MKTLNNFRIDNKFEEITISQVTICAPSTAVYKLTLPIDDGLVNQVLTTDGNGVTSWTSPTSGTVTSVDFSTGMVGFTAGGGPITESGTLTLAYSGAAIPVINGGTGTTTSTGSGSVVLNTSATMSSLTGTGITNFTGNTRVTGFTGDMMYIGSSIGNLMTSILRWTGTTNDPNNHFDIGFFGTGTSFEFRADGLATFADLEMTGTIQTPELLLTRAAFTNTIITQATEDWTLSLPVDGGDAGQVLTTDGSGITSWTGNGVIGTVISVDFDTSMVGFTAGGGPITSSGTLTLAYSGAAIPVVNGGTGTTTSTGTGSVVLSDNPVIEQPVITGSGTSSTVIDTAATSPWTLILPVDGGTEDDLLLTDGTGVTRWVNLQPFSLEIILGELSLSVSMLATIAGTAQLAGANAGTIVSQGIAIGLNTTAIGNNATAIGTNFTAIGNNATAIGTNLTNIGNNATAIGTNLTNIGNNTTAIGNNLTAIGNNTTAIGTNTGSITTQGGLIAGLILTMGNILPLPPIIVQPSLAATAIILVSLQLQIDSKIEEVGIAIPAFLTVSNSPITSLSGSPLITIGLDTNNNALPVTSGGTGVFTSTGGGSVVLNASPTMSSLTGTGITNFTGNTRVTGFTGDMMYIGSAIGTRTTSILRWTGTTDDPSNHFDIAFFGTGSTFEFRADGLATFVDLEMTGTIQTPELLLTQGAFTTTIFTQATEDWTLGLPLNAGSAGQVLTTNGGASTSWTSAVTSVDIATPTFLTATGGPITSSGTITLAYNATPLPTANGGTGSTAASTGSGGVVLANSPTLSSLTGNGITNFTANTRVTGFTGDMMYIGSAIGTRTTSILRWTGTTNDVNNHLDIGFFGTGTSFEFRADGLATFDNLLVTGVIQTPGLLLTQGAFTNTIITQATEDWTLSLPVDGGTAGQVLATDGSGTTIWTSSTAGAVTSVDIATPTFLTATGGPITSSGVITLAYNATPLPTANGGTGSTAASTGSGGVVLATSPTMSSLTGTGITNFTANTRVTGFTGDMMYIGSSVGNNTTSILRWTGTTNDVNNHLDIGFFGSGTEFEFRADGVATFESLVLTTTPLAVSSGGTGTSSSTGTGSLVLATSPSISGATLTGNTGVTGNMFLNDNNLFLRNDAFHGLKFNSSIDGPEVFGFAKGRLSTNSTGRMWWKDSGISTNDSDFFKYTESDFTIGWGGDGNAVFTEDEGHYVKCGQQTTVVVQINVVVASATNNRDVFFTGLGLTNPLSFFQRCNVSFGVVPARIGPYNFTIQNGATDLLLFDGLNNRVTTAGDGTFIGTFYAVFSYVST